MAADVGRFPYEPRSEAYGDKDVVGMLYAGGFVGIRIQIHMQDNRA